MTLRGCVAPTGVAIAAAVGLLACTTPPVGWQGAGRSQTLPQPVQSSSTSDAGGGDGGAAEQASIIDMSGQELSDDPEALAATDETAESDSGAP